MYSNVDVGDREHGKTKKLHGTFMVWWRGCWWGRAGGCKEGLGLSECGGWASNGVQIELRAPLRFCMVKSELHFNFDWAPFGIGKWDPTWFFFFAMKTSLHDLILFFCNGDFIARPDSFFVMALPFRSHWKKNQALIKCPIWNSRFSLRLYFFDRANTLPQTMNQNRQAS